MKLIIFLLEMIQLVFAILSWIPVVISIILNWIYNFILDTIITIEFLIVKLEAKDDD